MPDPNPYTVGYSFSGFQASAPAAPLPAAPVDNEFANIAAAIAELVAAVKDTRRSDGALKAGIVTLDSLSAGLIAGLTDLDASAAAAFDLAVASVQASVDSDIAALAASKAALVHTHAATDVSVAAISGIVGADVQAVLAELRLLTPQTGDFKLTLRTGTIAGWVRCNDGTIGNTGSGATSRANADTLALYTLLWENVSDTWAPVSGGRSATAAADFALLRPIALTKMLGRALALSGTGATLTARTLGQTLGAETHQLAISEMPAHTHGGATGSGGVHNHTYDDHGSGTNNYAVSATAGADNSTVSRTTGNSTDHTHTISTQGGGGSHNNMQPTSFLNAYLKL